MSPRSYGIATAMLHRQAAISCVERLCVPGAVPVFGSAPWVLAAWRHLPELGSPTVLTVEDALATWVLPLSLRRDPHGVVLSLAGAPLGDAHDLVGPRPRPPRRLAVLALDRLVLACRGRGIIELDALASEGSLGSLVMAAGGAWRLEHEPSPVIPIAAATVPASHARRWRRLARQGRLSVQVIEGPRLRGPLVQEFLRRRLGRWRTQGRLDELPRVERAATFPLFLIEAVTRLASAGQARMWVLLLDGEPVAEDLHLGAAERPILYMRNYALSCAASSPGRLLLEATLLGLRNAGATALETGRGGEAYKLALGGGAEFVVSARLIVRPRLPEAPHRPC